MRQVFASFCVVMSLCSVMALSVPAGEPLHDYYHHDGPLAGTLKSEQPLPLFEADPQHLWNRLYSTLYIRPRQIPATDDQPSFTRFEGGDVIEFLAWGRTGYWSTEDVFDKLNPLLDEFLTQAGGALIADPLKRIVLQHDLWAAYDHLADLNIRRVGDLPTRTRRDTLCRKLAECMQQLAISQSEMEQLPDTYTVAVNSGAFAPQQNLDSKVNYLPYGLLTNPEEWAEIDFYYPDMHEDIMDRFISLHARSFKGRSHYRIFYRFPEGRRQVVDYLKQLADSGIDWKRAANFGFIRLDQQAPPFPVGAEFVLLQQMVVLNDRLQPVPTDIVESVQLRVYANIDGSSQPDTNTGLGMNILDYRMKRHLLFDGLKHGGLERELEELGAYRVAIDGSKPTAPDWGFADKEVLFQQCADCHLGRRQERLGAPSVPTLTHSGGFDAGAMMGVSHAIGSEEIGNRAKRVARYKSRHETYRRLLEHVGR